MLLTLEGIDGSGKTTVLESVKEELGEVNTAAVSTREPSPHWTGPAVRQAIDDDTTHPLTDLFFFLGDRANHIKHTIAPALDNGLTVISDRYSDSTRAYQKENIGAYVDNPVQYIDGLLGDWHIEPDLTILLDIPAEKAVARANDGDKYEVPEFLKRVRKNYLELAESYDRIEVIDATQPEERVCNIATSIVLENLER
jgi:dTMP kinase